MLDGYKQLTPKQTTDANRMKQLESEFKTLCSDYAGREGSLAITNMEQASMWAVKAITK